ncbi:MAG: dihydroorotate dehydrogenase electron transfer subunit [Dysgonamonadaceae bacterium]|jgi:dihydroorotate dehydrogenase electron transfer subunit|nr:dihydroorotate dehydrogenase electron transfer subunit [Dysgonamonadaceae bacterium]
MKKYISDWTVREVIRKGDVCLLRMVLEGDDPELFPDIMPGQFVQVKVEKSPLTYLRRPISIHFVNSEEREIGLLVQVIGEGTKIIAGVATGEKLNLIYPLGNGFSLPVNEDKRQRFLLVGGGVGVAPLLLLGHRLKRLGFTPDFLLGAFSADKFFDNKPFEETGNLYLTTEDGSAGEKGYVTDHTVLETWNYDFIYTCGPRPMMKAIAGYALSKGIPCEVSLENTMACGIGACLCCVEKTVGGNVCVCTAGPVFNILELQSWRGLK